jgi:hypothetical protein
VVCLPGAEGGSRRRVDEAKILPIEECGRAHDAKDLLELTLGGGSETGLEIKACRHDHRHRGIRPGNM